MPPAPSLLRRAAVCLLSKRDIAAASDSAASDSADPGA